MKQIALSQGLFATVDDDDFAFLNQWKWSAMRVKKGHTERFYAVRMQKRGEAEKPKLVLMHRALTDAPQGMDVDHCDNDGLNNRRDNLRICTRRQNMLNRPADHGSSSAFKGVSLRCDGKKWVARFMRKNLGSFETQEAAAAAHDRAAFAFDPEFARLNLELEGAE